MTDSMDRLLEMQKIIMEKVPHDLSPEKTRLITAGMGVIEETLEFLNSVGRKPWRPDPLPQEKQIEELADILHFYLELILLSGFSWERIVEEYPRKHAINLKRYLDGDKGDFSWDDRAEKREL